MTGSTPYRYRDTGPPVSSSEMYANKKTISHLRKSLREAGGLKLNLNIIILFGLRLLAFFIHPLTGSRAYFWRAVACIMHAGTKVPWRGCIGNSHRILPQGLCAMAYKN